MSQAGIISWMSFPPPVVGTVATLAEWNAMCDGEFSSNMCDVWEWRIDSLHTWIGEAQFLEMPTRKPVIITVRHVDEGGLSSMTRAQRHAWMAALLSQATAIDIEIAYLEDFSDIVSLAHAENVAVIASAHNFQEVQDLAVWQERERLARHLGADIVKFAFFLNSPEDIIVGTTLLEERSGPMAVMGMGVLGAVSRLLYAQMGSCLVYGCVGENAVAPGQWPVAQFRQSLALLTPFLAKNEKN